MKEYHVSIFAEKEMAFGIGLERVTDSYWTKDKLHETCVNGHIIDKHNGINGISVVKRLDGTFCIIQFSGYTEVSGLYGYEVNPDNTLERFC